MEYFYLILFVFLAFIKIRRNIVYILPFLALIITNLNALLNNDSFGLGSLNFSDYIFPITFFVFILYKVNNYSFKYFKDSITYKFFLIYIYYQVFLIFYSLSINKEDVIWIFKIGRYQFYGLFVMLTFIFIEKNPVLIFEKMIGFTNKVIIFFTVLFLIDSLAGISIFVLADYHKMISDNGIEMKRNFYAYPIFSGYFYIYNMQKLIDSKSKKHALINLGNVIIILLAIIAIMTRGFVIGVFVCTLALLFLNRLDFKKRLLLILFVSLFVVIGVYGVLNYIPEYTELIERLFEIKNKGLSGTANFQVREQWLKKAIENVNSFNIFFGFGYTRPDPNIFKFMSFSAGNPDNAFANIIGMQGFIGFFIFCSLVISWLITNWKLRRLKTENISKINFVYIIWLIISTQNSNTFSFIQSFGFFLAYDIVTYNFFVKLNQGLIILNTKSTNIKNKFNDFKS